METKSFIDGIFNYCDRWCERCRFVDRCRLASHEQLRNAAHRAAGRDPHDWDVVAEDLSQSFAETISLVREEAQRLGIDIEPETDAEAKEIEEQVVKQGQRARKHPIYVAALDFTDRVHTFLETYGESLVGELDRQALGDEAALVEDAIDTLSWYHTQVPAKIFRAVHDVCNACDESALDELDRHDADGSAKVAHLGLVRSMQALMVLQSHRPWLREEATRLLLKIGDLVDLIDEQFPGHVDFKRPGFDG